MDEPTNYRTLVFIDLETTGLLIDQPKIIELAMVAVDVEILQQTQSDEKFPRVLNKFVKTFNPLKSLCSEVSQVSGFTDEILKNFAPFTSETVKSIETFLNDFPKPICFVAHNGNQFDFPIFWMEIQSALSNENLRADVTLQTNLGTIDCADSLIFFRQMYQIHQERRTNHRSIPNAFVASALPIEQNQSIDMPVKYVPSIDPTRQQPSMKLSKIYEREFHSERSNFVAHRAEDDCLMLLAILKRYLNDWLKWINENHRCLNQFSSTM